MDYLENRQGENPSAREKRSHTDFTMNNHINHLVSLLILPLCCLLTGLAGADPGTAEDRAVLFDYILEKTMERGAFSPIKNRNLNLDIEEAMRSLRDELIEADTDEKLYYALVKLSNSRRDRHLKVGLVKGGLTLENTAGTVLGNYPDPGTAILHAPIRFAVDFGTPDSYFLFVSDFAANMDDYAGADLPEVGDRLTAVNGRPIADYIEEKRPYHRHSSELGIWRQFAAWMPQRNYQFPPRFYKDDFSCTLERPNGELYKLSLPYLDPDAIEWAGHGARRFGGFELVFSTPTFDFYRSEAGKPVILLDWHRFHSNLVADIDRLMDYAVEHNLLDHAIIWDATRSGGGGRGVYAIQRLSPKPFITTFGNLRISDVTPAFIEKMRDRYRGRSLRKPGAAEPPDARENLDDGSWLMDWLESDVTDGIRAGQSYTNNVPFKLAHLPKYADGWVNPARVHFRGPMVCLLSPYGGSHLSQFASIVVDNSLAPVLGMPDGGYSNTWEWTEVLVLGPGKKPIVSYMWNIGHTIRPNGEILEGNAVKVDEYIPVTSGNYPDYHQNLIERALELLDL